MFVDMVSYSEIRKDFLKKYTEEFLSPRTEYKFKAGLDLKNCG